MHITHTTRGEWSWSNRALLVVHLIIIIYMGLCAPDLYAGLERTVGGDAARERLTAAVEGSSELSAGAPEAGPGKPYPRGAVQRATVGDALVVTTRSAADEPLCTVRFADGTTTNSWEDGRNELCPASVPLPVPTTSPVDPSTCLGARCWLALTEHALWRCVEQTGTPEGCNKPDALRRHGLPTTTPLAVYTPGTTLPVGSVSVNTSALLEGVVTYTVVAAEPGAQWTLSFYSETQQQAVLACAGPACPS